MDPYASTKTLRSVLTTLKLQTGIWYNDRPIELSFPPEWQVETHWPNTPPPLDDAAIADRIDSPIGCPTIGDQVAGKKRVTIVVDDLSRPTPAHRVLPPLLERIERGGFDPADVMIVVATGTHGKQDEAGLRNKLGPEAFDRCRIHVHDDLRDLKHVGRTSFGTLVYVNKHVRAADLLIGIGGVYPQHSTGFGGGGKLALGIAGRQTIMGLHYKHGAVGGTYNTDNDFRRDVTEIAAMIGLRTSITVHIDAFSNVVNVLCGDHGAYYDDAAHFSKEYFTAPVAEDADVVIANAYPLDTSFIFMRKGYKPLFTAPRSAVKIMIASAYEGVGVHGLFQHIDPSLWVHLRNRMIEIRGMGFKEFVTKATGKIWRTIRPPRDQGEEEEYGPVTALPPNTDHLYVLRTDPAGGEIHPIDDLTICEEWGALLQSLPAEKLPTDRPVRVHLYPCAPLQCLDYDDPDMGDFGAPD